MTTIRFSMNTKKALEALVWLLRHHPGLTRHTISKVLYYADKRHLQEYGRPVIGDRYVAMNEGMVPSRVLDLLEKDGQYLRPKEIEAREEALRGYENENGDPAYEALREPDTDYLSRSDIQALRWSLEEYGDKGFEELRRVAHEEPAWEKVYEPDSAEEMDWQDIIDADHPKRDLLLKKLRETSKRIVF